MKNIVDILKSFGVEVPEDKVSELNKQVNENYKTIAEYDKMSSKLSSERDDYKTQLEAAQTALEGFEGIDVDAVQKELEGYKAKMHEQEQNHKQELYDRDFTDALNAAVSELKFSSEAAKKTVLADIKASGLKLIDGKIMGLNDYIAAYKERDASAFIDEQKEQLENNKARFSAPMKNQTGDKPSMSELMRMKTENPNLDISSYLRKGDK